MGELGPLWTGRSGKLTDQKKQRDAERKTARVGFYKKFIRLQNKANIKDRHKLDL